MNNHGDTYIYIVDSQNRNLRVYLNYGDGILLNNGDSIIKNKYSDNFLLIKPGGRNKRIRITYGCPKEKRIKIIEKIKREKMQK